MESILLLVLFLIGILIVLPIWTLVSLSTVRRENRELARRLALLEAGVEAGAAAVRAETAREPITPMPVGEPARMEPGVPTITPHDVTAESRAPSGPESTPPMDAGPGVSLPPPIPPPLPSPPLPPPRSIPVPVPVVAQPAPKPRINWEVFMGVKLFAWIGGLALFLGVGFFVKYSFEHDLIPPEVRVALGFLTGAGLIAGGSLLARKRYAVTAQTLCATGVVSLYAVTFSCHAVYHFPFFDALPTFGLMALVTVAAFLLAIRMEAKVVAILGLLGGFLTPLLLSTGQDNALGLFGYVALLDIGLIAVALHRQWHFLVPLGAACTALMQIGWKTNFFDETKQPVAQGVVLGFCLLFYLAFAAGRRWRQQPVALLATAATLPFTAFVFAWWFFAYPTIVERPASLFVFILLANLVVLGVAWLDPRAARLHALAGIAAFALLAVWTQRHLDLAQLNVALAAFLGFAVVQTAAPLLLARRHPGLVGAAGWQQLWPAFMLGLVLLGIGRLPEVPVALWIAVLLLDVLAIAVAVACASILGVIVVLVLTLASAGSWLLRMPTETANLTGLLIVVGGFATLFVGAAIWLLKRFGSESNGEDQASKISRALQAQLPTLSVLLPFILLIMVVARLPLSDPSPVYGLALLLTVLALGLTHILRLSWLPLGTLIGAVALMMAWQARHFDPAMGTRVLGWYVLFHLIFAVYPFLFRRRLSDLAGPWIAGALSGVFLFPLVLTVVGRTWPNDIMGLLPAAFALPAFASLAGVLRLLPDDHPRRLGTQAWFGGVALFFVTLIFPIQFERQWITLGWALEGVALLWWFQRVPHPGLRLTGLGLLVAAFVRLALNPGGLDSWIRGDIALLNWLLYTYLTVAACQFVAARLLSPPRDRVFGRSVTGGLQAMGVILLFILVNLQVADFFGEAGSRVRLEFSGNFARDMTYTIAWSLFALVLLIIGLWKNLRPARWAALGLLSAALLKLFFHDLSQLGQLYRIGALIAVAVVAIVASFIYQRFLPSSAPIDDASPPPTPPPTS